MRRGYVYFVAAQSRDLLIKIGFAKDPFKRLRTLQTGSPLDLELFGYVAGTEVLERRLHRIFERDRMHGEWFVADGYLRDLVFGLVACGGNRRPTTSEEFSEVMAQTTMLMVADNPRADGSPLTSQEAMEPLQ